MSNPQLETQAEALLQPDTNRVGVGGLCGVAPLPPLLSSRSPQHSRYPRAPRHRLQGGCACTRWLGEASRLRLPVGAVWGPCALCGSGEVAQWPVEIGTRWGLLPLDQFILLPALLPPEPSQFLYKGSGQAGSVSGRHICK